MKNVEINTLRRELDENETRVLFSIPPDYQLSEAKVYDSGHGRILAISFHRARFDRKVSISAMIDTLANQDGDHAKVPS